MSNSDRLTGPDFLDSVADQSAAQGLPVNAAEFRQRATDWRADQARIEQLEADLARLERQLRSDTERARILDKLKTHLQAANEALAWPPPPTPPTRLTAETSNARGWVLVPRWNMERVAETLERDGDEHGAAYELRDMLAAAPPPAAAEPKTLPVPTRVYLTDKAAVIVGDPQRGWDEEGPEAHNCDDMGCSTIGPHVLARVPFTDERALAATQKQGQAVAWQDEWRAAVAAKLSGYGLSEEAAAVFAESELGEYRAGLCDCAENDPADMVDLMMGVALDAIEKWKAESAGRPFGYKRAAPPSAPVGVEGPLSLLRAGHWREVYIGHRCMRLEVTYDYATWERLMAEVESALALQPAAVGEDIMVNAAHGVFTLPLQPSGLLSGPRFVVHVPGPEQPAAVDEAQGEAIRARRQQIAGWLEGLGQAARSLRTIADQAGKVEGMEDMEGVRGYANSRATVAEAALAANDTLAAPPAAATR